MRRVSEFWQAKNKANEFSVIQKAEAILSLLIDNVKKAQQKKDNCLNQLVYELLTASKEEIEIKIAIVAGLKKAELSDDEKMILFQSMLNLQNDVLRKRNEDLDNFNRAGANDFFVLYVGYMFNTMDLQHIQSNFMTWLTKLAKKSTPSLHELAKSLISLLFEDLKEKNSTTLLLFRMIKAIHGLMINSTQTATRSETIITQWIINKIAYYLLDKASTEMNTKTYEEAFTLCKEVLKKINTSAQEMPAFQALKPNEMIPSTTIRRKKSHKIQKEMSAITEDFELIAHLKLQVDSYLQLTPGAFSDSLSYRERIQGNLSYKSFRENLTKSIERPPTKVTSAPQLSGHHQRNRSRSTGEISNNVMQKEEIKPIKIQRVRSSEFKKTEAKKNPNQPKQQHLRRTSSASDIDKVEFVDPQKLKEKIIVPRKGYRHSVAVTAKRGLFFGEPKPSAPQLISHQTEVPVKRRESVAVQSRVDFFEKEMGTRATKKSTPNMQVQNQEVEEKANTKEST